MNFNELLPWLGQYSPPTALVVLVVISIIKGGLVPRSTVDALIGEKNEWREAFWKMHKASETQTETTTKLTQQAETTTKLINSLPTPTDLKPAGDKEGET